MFLSFNNFNFEVSPITEKQLAHTFPSLCTNKFRILEILFSVFLKSDSLITHMYRLCIQFIHSQKKSSQADRFLSYHVAFSWQERQKQMKKKTKIFSLLVQFILLHHLQQFKMVVITKESIFRVKG